jgi:hypothetical protein
LNEAEEGRLITVRVNCCLGLRHHLINANSSEIYYFLNVNGIYLLSNDNKPNYGKRSMPCGTEYRNFVAIFVSAHIGVLHDYTLKRITNFLYILPSTGSFKFS